MAKKYHSRTYLASCLPGRPAGWYQMPAWHQRFAWAFKGKEGFSVGKGGVWKGLHGTGRSPALRCVKEESDVSPNYLPAAS